MSWGLTNAEAITGCLELALVCTGFLRSLKSHCFIEGSWTAAPCSSASLCSHGRNLQSRCFIHP